MRNLNNINHWIAELRDVAIRNVVHNEGEEGILMPLRQINEIFNKGNFGERFEDGLTPQGAFDEEMEFWNEG